MPNVSVTIKGTTELINQFKKTNAKINSNIQKGLKASALLSQRVMKQKSPIDTGTLHRSIVINTDNLKNNEISIGPDTTKAPYAAFVEYGHHTRSGSFVSGQYFVRDTITQVSPIIDNIFRELISQALKPS